MLFGNRHVPYSWEHVCIVGKTIEEDSFSLSLFSFLYCRLDLCSTEFDGLAIYAVSAE